MSFTEQAEVREDVVGGWLTELFRLLRHRLHDSNRKSDVVLLTRTCQEHIGLHVLHKQKAHATQTCPAIPESTGKSLCTG